MDIHIAPRIDRLVDLINSRGAGFDAGVDQLDQPEAAIALMRRFIPDWEPGDGAAITRIKRLRDALLTLIIRRSEKNTDWAELNAIAEDVSFRLQFSSGEHVEWERRDGDLLVAAALQDIAAVMQSGQWGRIKICANEACGSAFYDATRGKTQRWHSYTICGNKNNVAAYRSRHAREERI